MKPTSEHPGSPLSSGAWRAWLELARISNLPSAWGNVIAGVAVVAGWSLLTAESAGVDGVAPRLGDILAAAWAGGLGWGLLAATLMYLAGMLLNDAKDADWDRTHRPERPIPSGRVGRRAVWMAGGGCWLGGLLAGFMVQGGWPFALALAVAVPGYTWSHKVWAGSVVLMAACRVLLVLLGAAGLMSVEADAGAPVAGPLSWWPPVIGGLVLGAYIMGLTLMARTEATSGRVPVISWLLLLTPLVWALALLWLFSRPGTGIALVALSVWIIWVRLRRRRDGAVGTGAAVGRLLAGMTLVDAIGASLLSLPLALIFVVAAPTLRLWQRWVAAS